MNLNLPPNWSWVKLGDVGKIMAGGTPSTKIKEYFDGKIAWITPADLTGYKDKFILKGRRNITDKGLKYSSARLIPKGSILFSSRAPIGYVVIAANDVATNQGFKNLVPSEKVFNEFVYYYLKSAKRLAEQYGSGTTFKEISAKSFANLPFPLPPLPEQKKIVAKIEELFSQLDNGIEQLKKAKKQLKVYRQAVLSWAFSGKLVKGQKSKVKSQKEMLKAAEPEVEYKTNGLPEGWKWKSLKEIATILGDGLHGTPKYTSEGEYYFINGNNLSDGKIELKTSKQVSLEEYEKYKKPLNERTLFVSINGTLGKTAFYNNERIILGKSACYFNLKDNIDKRYIRYYITTQQFLNYANKTATGSTIKNVSLKAMREFEIPLPATFEEQCQIVSEIESRFSVADKLEQIIDENLVKANRLRQSILKRAFEGKLFESDIREQKIEKGFTPFQKMQVIGAIIKNFEENGIIKGEMIIAKYLYLLEKLYNIKTGFLYKKHNFGPYTPELKKILFTPHGYLKQIGKGYKAYFSITKEETLFKYTNPLVDQVNKHFPELISLFAKYPNASTRDLKIELLATVSKVIEDDKVVNANDIYIKMHDWKTDVKMTGHSSKAGKFTKAETERCLNFIIKQGWDKKLIEI